MNLTKTNFFLIYGHIFTFTYFICVCVCVGSVSYIVYVLTCTHRMGIVQNQNSLEQQLNFGRYNVSAVSAILKIFNIECILSCCCSVHLHAILKLRFILFYPHAILNAALATKYISFSQVYIRLISLSIAYAVAAVVEAMMAIVLTLFIIFIIVIPVVINSQFTEIKLIFSKYLII